MLQRVQPVVSQFRGVRMTENAEDTAIMFGIFLHQVVWRFPHRNHSNDPRIGARIITISHKSLVLVALFDVRQLTMPATTKTIGRIAKSAWATGSKSSTASTRTQTTTAPAK